MYFRSSLPPFQKQSGGLSQIILIIPGFYTSPNLYYPGYEEWTIAMVIVFARVKRLN